jgi:hypothetical protein
MNVGFKYRRTFEDTKMRNIENSQAQKGSIKRTYLVSSVRNGTTGDPVDILGIVTHSTSLEELAVATDIAIGEGVLHTVGALLASELSVDLILGVISELVHSHVPSLVRVGVVAADLLEVQLEDRLTAEELLNTVGSREKSGAIEILNELLVGIALIHRALHRGSSSSGSKSESDNSTHILPVKRK